jgi:hypothetical protein
VNARSRVRGLVGHVKVAHLGDVVVKEQHVAGLDVAVDDARLRLVVEELQPSRRAHGDPHALHPRQGWTSLGTLLVATLFTMEDVMKRASWCVLISKNTDVLFGAVSNQLDNILMLHSRHGRHLQKKRDRSSEKKQLAAAEELAGIERKQKEPGRGTHGQAV